MNKNTNLIVKAAKVSNRVIEWLNWHQRQMMNNPSVQSGDIELQHLVTPPYCIITCRNRRFIIERGTKKTYKLGYLGFSFSFYINDEIWLYFLTYSMIRESIVTVNKMNVEFSNGNIRLEVKKNKKVLKNVYI